MSMCMGIFLSYDFIIFTLLFSVKKIKMMNIYMVSGNLNRRFESVFVCIVWSKIVDPVDYEYFVTEMKDKKKSFGKS